MLWCHSIANSSLLPPPTGPDMPLTNIDDLSPPVCLGCYLYLQLSAAAVQTLARYLHLLFMYRTQRYVGFWTFTFVNQSIVAKFANIVRHFLDPGIYHDSDTRVFYHVGGVDRSPFRVEWLVMSFSWRERGMDIVKYVGCKFGVRRLALASNEKQVCLTNVVPGRARAGHLFLTIPHSCLFLPPPHQTIWSTFSPCL